jgi:pimeloyl-ACP methyl ester carboxylesterase
MAKIRINGCLHVYEIVGSGPHVTLLHTVGLSTREGWRNQIGPLSRRYTILTYDIRGLGESEGGAGPLTVETFAKDLVALLDALEIHRTALIGASLGGAIAQTFAIDHPERVRGLVLVSTTCKFAAEAAAKLRDRNQRILKSGMQVAVDAQVETQFSEPFIQSYPEVISWYRSHYLANRPQHYVEIMEDQARLDLCERLRSLRCPTLIVTGADDLSPVRGREPLESAHRLRDLISGSRLSVIPGSRHYPHIDRPDLFNETVFSFLQNLEA